MLTSKEPRFGSPVNGTDDREACQKSWIALYTRPRSEKKVRAYLDRLGIENYLPVQNQLRQWSDRKKMVEVAVIPMVIFVVDSQYTPELLSNSLIIKPLTAVGGGKKIALIPDSEIAQLKFMLGQSEYPVSFDPGIVRISDKVRVIRGPLKGLTGEVLNYDDKFLELAVTIGISGAARLNIEKINVEVL